MQLPGGAVGQEGGVLQLSLDLLAALFQLLQLAGAGEDAGIAVDAAAGHGAAGVDDLPVQRDDAEAVVVALSHLDAAVQILHHHRGAQKILYNGAVFFFITHKLRGDAHEAVLIFQPVFPQTAAADGVQRQEGGAAAVPLLQKTDGVLAVVLRVNDNMLQGAAQRDLNGHAALFICVDQVANGAVNAGERPRLGGTHDDLHRLGKALVLLFHFAE